MKKNYLLLPLVFVCAYAAAQNHAPYLVPQTVYVGDRALLVVPLNISAFGSAALEKNSVEKFSTEQIEIHRAALESKASGSRLIVEFSAYAPGLLEFPPVEIGGRNFSGLTVRINSVLGETETAVLSPSLPPVFVPGTGLVIYGTMAALIVVLLLALWTAVKGRGRFARWISARRRRRLIIAMRRVERRLRKKLQGGAETRFILDTLSGEFRSFLSIFTGENCRAKTAREFAELSFAKDTESSAETSAEWGSRFFETFFRRCDDLRFGRGEIVSDNALFLLGEIRQFTQALLKTRRERKMP